MKPGKLDFKIIMLTLIKPLNTTYKASFIKTSLPVLYHQESIHRIPYYWISITDCERQKILVRTVNSLRGIHSEQVSLSSASKVVSGGSGAGRLLLIRLSQWQVYPQPSQATPRSDGLNRASNGRPERAAWPQSPSPPAMCPIRWTLVNDIGGFVYLQVCNRYSAYNCSSVSISLCMCVCVSCVYGCRPCPHHLFRKHF